MDGFTCTERIGVVMGRQAFGSGVDLITRWVRV